MPICMTLQVSSWSALLVAVQRRRPCMRMRTRTCQCQSAQGGGYVNGSTRQQDANLTCPLHSFLRDAGVNMWLRDKMGRTCWVDVGEAKRRQYLPSAVSFRAAGGVRLISSLWYCPSILTARFSACCNAEGCASKLAAAPAAIQTKLLARHITAWKSTATPDRKRRPNRSCAVLRLLKCAVAATGSRRPAVSSLLPKTHAARGCTSALQCISIAGNRFCNETTAEHYCLPCWPRPVRYGVHSHRAVTKWWLGDSMPAMPVGDLSPL